MSAKRRNVIAMWAVRSRTVQGEQRVGNVCTVAGEAAATKSRSSRRTRSTTVSHSFTAPQLVSAILGLFSMMVLAAAEPLSPAEGLLMPDTATTAALDGGRGMNSAPAKYRG